MQNEEGRHTPGNDAFRTIFEALPPLDSPEYFEHLRMAAAQELPAQVLVRAYRQLSAARRTEAAHATLERLLGHDEKYGYLKAVRFLAKSFAARGYYFFDTEDLVQATVVEIIKVLPTARGAMAESAWVVFCRQRLVDAWRQLAGRRGERIRAERVEPGLAGESGKTNDPLDNVSGSADGWRAQIMGSQLPWLKDFIRETIESINDPVTRLVALDQFGDDRSRISSGTSASGKPPLTEQLGVSRYAISRALKRARLRLAAALLASKDHDIDLDWLRALYRDLD
jgi:hypothetical protein